MYRSRPTSRSNPYLSEASAAGVASLAWELDTPSASVPLLGVGSTGADVGWGLSRSGDDSGELVARSDLGWDCGGCAGAVVGCDWAMAGKFHPVASLMLGRTKLYNAIKIAIATPATVDFCLPEEREFAMNGSVNGDGRE
tara:strand:- start:614 stop:1033 length:420 start_codon:yes stop_codon:yes gene_type:complete